MGWIKGEGEIEDSYKISKIAAHVPDLVVYSTLTNDIPYAENFHGVLLFADVSGFTNLTEKFSLSSKKGYGADELTRTLNSYIGEIVSHILDAGGDILNYAGDAILALWTVERVQLSEVISLVVKCSLNIQDQCGVRETEVGCQLKVKIGISAGKLSKVTVGDEISQYFVVIGRAVDEVRLAEGLAVASTIILSPNAWELCERDNIAIDPIENERAVEVRYIKREPSFSVEKYQDSIGHPVRHEYTVIGRKVNLAARLMMHYPGVVSCDSETCYYSKLPAFYFNELPKKAMKGVKNPGVLYQFMANKQQMYDHLM
uniref:Soluble adenylyl cyclase 35 kDa variant n=1 Tax=Oncorhynchus mykiss TaxID=8022 RepID=A0A2R4KZQ5_ONCMY|nr:soluble adenylyl cyclase 35 kDa variant [Oncorhynchus mykiss]